MLTEFETHLHAAGDEIDHLAWVLDVHHRRGELVGEVLGEGDHALEEIDDVALHRLDFDAALHLLRRGVDASAQVGLLGDELIDDEALQPLHDHLHSAIGDTQQAHDTRDGSDLEAVLWSGFLDVLILLRDQTDEAAATHDIVDQVDRAFFPRSERHHGERIDDDILERQDRQLLRDLEALAVGVVGAVGRGVLCRLLHLGCERVKRVKRTVGFDLCGGPVRRRLPFFHDLRVSCCEYTNEPLP